MQHVRASITHSPTRLLFPYDFTPDAPSGAHTPSLLAPSALHAITRKQVVDVLLRLVRERTPVEARVVEIALEYIGKRWHASEGDVEVIARKLSEIVSDVSCVHLFRSSLLSGRGQRAQQKFRCRLHDPTSSLPTWPRFSASVECTPQLIADSPP